VARELEARSYESFFVGEHYHLPVGSVHNIYETIPEFYKYVPDPFMVLSAAAAVTERFL
jgi:alkanesulfonate monooxygenase SsuD/methylene tetrahydromethanopterin reductase-like flavin-dependent oxidoreductase (luciferase family)